ncbi:unnamed protein product [Linum trigynum]|uniref:Uncharacterized protein n=1 Tax=Linum trigynum TaxID=586398 RepID=A0AAV2F969_9ROSI
MKNPIPKWMGKHKKKGYEDASSSRRPRPHSSGRPLDSVWSRRKSGQLPPGAEVLETDIELEIREETPRRDLLAGLQPVPMMGSCNDMETR